MVAEVRISISNNKNKKLIGYYQKQQKNILMIVCHGLESYSHPQVYKQVKPYLEAYAAMGISVLRFDFTGYGESEGEKGLHIQQSLSDIGSVLEQYGKEYKEIILNVSSLSGIIGVIAAIQYKKITKLMVTNGVFNFRQINFLLWIKLQFYLLLHPNTIRELHFGKKRYRPEDIKIPTLVVVSEKDTTVSPKQSFNFYNNLLTDKTLIIIPNVDHSTGSYDETYPSFKKVLQWLFLELNLPTPRSLSEAVT